MFYWSSCIPATEEMRPLELLHIEYSKDTTAPGPSENGCEECPSVNFESSMTQTAKRIISRERVHFRWALCLGWSFKAWCKKKKKIGALLNAVWISGC